MSVVAVIGGTGVESMDGLELTDRHEMNGPFGSPSQAITEGQFSKRRLYFLHRHGGDRSIPPHLINYRANLWALKELGVDQVVAINAVGGIGDRMRTGCLLIPDQLIDYTWGREHTFDDGSSGELMHIDFTEPYDRDLRMMLLRAAADARIEHRDSGVHGVMQGPRLETAAEIQRMARDGCDVVGMTGMPEASLARELGMAYASICMVVNPAAGLGEAPITLDMMREILRSEAAVVRQLLQSFLGL